MNTDPLYDKQTLLAIVLIAVVSAFICGAAIASYEEPSPVTETKGRMVLNETQDSGLVYASASGNVPSTAESDGPPLMGCFLTIYEEGMPMPKTITANNSLVIHADICNRWFNQLADMINEGLIDWTDLLIFTK